MSDALVLYQDEILEFGRHPRNFGPMQDATLEINGDSPICGDHMTLSLRVEKYRIADAKFTSTACCAVCKASSSMMTDVIKGMSIRETRSLIHTFLQMVKLGEISPAARWRMGKLIVFERIREAPSRNECVMLAWNTLDAGLGMIDGMASKVKHAGGNANVATANAKGVPGLTNV